jgi:cell wall-associated NlpC family hydrolase
MTVAEDKTLATRQAIIDLAREQVGCHYVWGGAGNTPGDEDGAFYRKSAVKLHANNAEKPKHSERDHGLGRKMPIILAATCYVDGYKVCAGRSKLTEVMALTRGDYHDDLLLSSEWTDQYTWPRPMGEMDSNHVVWGVSCDGVRHFDCIGFVNWCLSSNGYQFHHSINQVIAMTKAIATGSAKIAKADLLPGDILTIGGHHIGFASGDGTAIHASSTYLGVLESDLHGSGWDRAGRLSSNVWEHVG